MSNEKSFIKSIFGFSVSSWVNLFLGILYTVLSTRLISPEVYGQINLFMQSSETIMYIICLGLDVSLIRFFNERPNDESKQRFQTKLIFIVTLNMLVVFCIVTIFLFNRFNLFMFDRLSWYLTIMLFVSAYAHLLLRFFNISYRMSFDIKRYTVQNILIQSSTKLLTLAAALLNPTYEMIITFQITGIVIITLTYVVLQKKDLIENVFADNGGDFFCGYAPVFRFALFSAPLYISDTLNVLLSQHVIQSTLGAKMLGIYTSVAVFGAIFRVISTGFSTFWSAYVYRYYQTDKKRIKEMSDYIVIVGFLSMCCFVLFKDVFYLFIGDEYQYGKIIFAIILTVNIIDLLSQASYYGIAIVKKNHITAISNCLYLIVNAIVVYCGATYYGLLGAAIGVMFAKVALFLANTVIAQRYYISISSPMRFYIGFIMILLVATLPAWNLYISINTTVVLLIILSSWGIYKDQYKNIHGLIMKKLNK